MKTKKQRKKTGRPTKYKPILLLDIFDLAKQGHSDQRIGDIIGVDKVTFRAWKRNFPEVVQALDRARKEDETNPKTYEEFVFNRLPPDLQDYWNEITKPDNEPNAISRLEAMLEDSGRLGHQNLFLYALVHTNFDLSKSCKMTKVSKKKLEYWVQNDPRFGELLTEMEWHKKNFFEGALIDLVARGETAAVLFANKTYNADRGYGSKKQITKDVNVNVSGVVTHNHKPVKVEDLDLSLAERRNLLKALRAHQDPIDVTPKEDE